MIAFRASFRVLAAVFVLFAPAFASSFAPSLALTLVPAVAWAAEDEYAAVREKLELCTACHGPNGASEQPQYPILAGQHFYYLYVQLKDFKAGRRASEEMKEIVADLSKAEMRTMAKFFSEQKWPNLAYRPDENAALKGETATVAGQCVQCHRGGYEGDSRIPRLAGQYKKYLNKTMTDFKTKARNNSAAKSSLMKSYGEAEIAGMAEYLAGK